MAVVEDETILRIKVANVKETFRCGDWPKGSPTFRGMDVDILVQEHLEP